MQTHGISNLELPTLIFVSRDRDLAMTSVTRCIGRLSGIHIRNKKLSIVIPPEALGSSGMNPSNRNQDICVTLSSAYLLVQLLPNLLR